MSRFLVRSCLVRGGLMWMLASIPHAGTAAPDTGEATAAITTVARVHRVQPGDTAWGIARRYELPTAAIVSANELGDRAGLAVGMELVIPTVVRTHEVRRGETIWDIARLHGSCSRAIVRANQIRNTRRLYAGTELVIPPASECGRDALPPVAAAPTPKPEADSGDAKQAVGRAEEALRDARFEEALELADEGCRQIAEAPSSRPLLVRCHVLRGTVHIALADGDSAEGAFADALALEEGLTLDPTTTSPKVLDSFERVRGSTP